MGVTGGWGLFGARLFGFKYVLAFCVWLGCGFAWAGCEDLPSGVQRVASFLAM